MWQSLLTRTSVSPNEQDDRNNLSESKIVCRFLRQMGD